jgi:hypothetical protein
MKVAQRIGNIASEGKSSEKLYMENTLLRVFGALFCHDPKRARTRSGKIELNRGDKEKHLTIRLDPEYGQPGPFAHKVAVAVIKKQSDYGRPVRNNISFSERELMRLAGRNSWGGRDSEELALALKQIRYTHLIAHFKLTARYVERDFSIFNEVMIERRESHHDPIVACSVVLADPIVQALKDEHFTCLNHRLMSQLSTIGQATYMRLFFHFANLYDGRNRKRLAFAKRYDDICTEWLGGLVVAQHKSKIEERLGSHLTQLVRLGFLASYSVDKARTSPAAGGFVLTFRPGATFFDDYDRFYRRQKQGELQWGFDADQRDIGTPLQVAYLFTEKRTGQPAASIAYVSSGEVQTAKQLLAEISFEEMPAFLDYALAAAKRTDFDVQSLGGIKQYLASYKASRQTAAADGERARQEGARQKAEADRLAYDAHRRKQASRLFKTLPAREQQLIRGEARRKAASFRGSLRDMMEDRYLLSATARRHGDQLDTFDHWKAARA